MIDGVDQAVRLEEWDPLQCEDMCLAVDVVAGKHTCGVEGLWDWS